MRELRLCAVFATSPIRCMMLAILTVIRLVGVPESDLVLLIFTTTEYARLVKVLLHLMLHRVR